MKKEKGFVDPSNHRWADDLKDLGPRKRVTKSKRGVCGRRRGGSP
jgi:hypothetical protein